MSRPALTVCQGDMLVRLDKGKYFLAWAFKPKQCAARKAVVNHLFKAGLVVPARGPAQWAITDAGRDALAAWREANKELLAKRRREFWANVRLHGFNDKNKGECDVVS